MNSPESLITFLPLNFQIPLLWESDVNVVSLVSNVLQLLKTTGLNPVMTGRSFREGLSLLLNGQTTCVTIRHVRKK